MLPTFFFKIIIYACCKQLFVDFKQHDSLKSSQCQIKSNKIRPNTRKIRPTQRHKILILWA